LAYFFHQQAVASVRAHGEQQGALQHLLQRRFVAAHGQGQVARIKLQGVRRGVERGGPVKQHAVAVCVGG
jgi:hypothetical protein